MPRFTITLTGSRNFDFTTEVEAKTEMEALNIAHNKYSNTEDDDDRFTWGDWELDDDYEVEEEE